MSYPRPFHDYQVHDEFNVKGFFEEYRFLSNFHTSPVWFDGVLYPSVENAYQAAKCFRPEDRVAFVPLTASAAKQRGNVVMLRNDWEAVKYEIMAALVFDKFYRHSELRRALLLTGDKWLEETNHWNDRTWGVCKDSGKNWLGKILMKVRAFWQDKHSVNGTLGSVHLHDFTVVEKPDGSGRPVEERILDRAA